MRLLLFGLWNSPLESLLAILSFIYSASWGMNAFHATTKKLKLQKMLTYKTANIWRIVSFKKIQADMKFIKLN